MKRLRKALLSLLLMALLLQSLPLPAQAASTPFIDSTRWEEVPVGQITTMKNSGESFVVMFFKYTCPNSKLRKDMIRNWMEQYDKNVYGVDCGSYPVPSWVELYFQNQGKAVDLPVICIVKDYEATLFSAKDSMRSIQKALQEYWGIYDQSEINFSRLNKEIYGSYATGASAAAQYLIPEAEIDAAIRTEARNIVQNASGGRDKVKAIYDWVTTNIYYNYGMLDGSVPRKTSALDTYTSKASVCLGYANLTAALCSAAGIPCRVVTGFATGVETESTAGAVWQLYETYLANGSLAQFAAQASRYTNHAWNEAYVDGKWLILDTTWGSNNDYYPDQQGRIKGTPTEDYFDPTLDAFSDSHLFWTSRAALTAAAAGGRITVTGLLEAEHAAAASRGLLASYDARGRMLACTAAALSGTAFSQSLPDAGNAAEVRLFLLDGGNAPAAPRYFAKVLSS